MAPTETLEKSLESSTNTPSCSVDSTECETGQSTTPAQLVEVDNSSTAQGKYLIVVICAFVLQQ